MHTLKEMRGIVCNQIQDVTYEQMKYVDFLINSGIDVVCSEAWANFRVFAHELTQGQATYNLFNCPVQNQDVLITITDVLVKPTVTDNYMPLIKKSMYEVSRIYQDWWNGTEGTPTTCAIDKDFLIIVPASSSTVVDGIIVTAYAKADKLVQDSDICVLHSPYQGYVIDWCLLKLKNDIAGCMAYEQFLRTKRHEKLARLDKFLEVKQNMLGE